MKTAFLLPLLMVASVSAHAVSRSTTASATKCLGISGTFANMQNLSDTLELQSVEYDDTMIYSFGEVLLYGDNTSHKIKMQGQSGEGTSLTSCTASGFIFKLQALTPSKVTRNAEGEVRVINNHGDIIFKMKLPNGEIVEKVLVKKK